MPGQLCIGLQASQFPRQLPRECYKSRFVTWTVGRHGSRSKGGAMALKCTDSLGNGISRLVRQILL